MSTATTLTPAFATGEPATHRGITVVPLYPVSEPVAAYITLAEAIALGLSVTEVDEDGVVGELLVANPTPHRVLIVAESLGRRESLLEMLRDHTIEPPSVATLAEFEKDRQRMGKP